MYQLSAIQKFLNFNGIYPANLGGFVGGGVTKRYLSIIRKEPNIQNIPEGFSVDNISYLGK